jgi:hypothetical protein
MTTVLLAGFGTDRLRREQPMKTAGRENPNRWVTVPSTRVHGAEVQNRSRSIKWAGKQEKLQSKKMCFFLTSPFIELHRTWPPGSFASGTLHPNRLHSEGLLSGEPSRTNANPNVLLPIGGHSPGSSFQRPGAPFFIMRRQREIAESPLQGHIPSITRLHGTWGVTCHRFPVPSHWQTPRSLPCFEIGVNLLPL